MRTCRALAARLSERVSALVGAEAAARADAKAAAARLGDAQAAATAQAAALRVQLDERERALQRLNALLSQRASLQETSSPSPADASATSATGAQQAAEAVMGAVERGETAKDAQIARLEVELQEAANEVAVAHARLRNAEASAAEMPLWQEPAGRGSRRSESTLNTPAVAGANSSEEAAVLARRAAAAERALANAEAGRAEAERAALAARAEAARLQVRCVYVITSCQLMPGNAGGCHSGKAATPLCMGWMASCKHVLVASKFANALGTDAGHSNLFEVPRRTKKDAARAQKPFKTPCYLQAELEGRQAQLHAAAEAAEAALAGERARTGAAQREAEVARREAEARGAQLGVLMETVEALHSGSQGARACFAVCITRHQVNRICQGLLFSGHIALSWWESAAGAPLLGRPVSNCCTCSLPCRGGTHAERC